MPVRLQIWDTAGQERFRSLSKLYYRGAHAALLCYSICEEKSFLDMMTWMRELRRELGQDVIVHVVGMKADIVALDPGKRQVPFERAVQYVAEQCGTVTRVRTNESNTSTSANNNRSRVAACTNTSTSTSATASNRSSGFWAADNLGWDCCHEISAKDGEGVDEVFRVLTRKLVERAERVQLQRHMQETAVADDGYFDGAHGSVGANGSFRLGKAASDKRRSWLGGLTTTGGINVRSWGVAAVAEGSGAGDVGAGADCRDEPTGSAKGRCC